MCCCIGGRTGNLAGAYYAKCWGRGSQCSNFYNHYVGHRDREDQLHYAMDPVCVEAFEILKMSICEVHIWAE